jgi:glycine/D-amino acid oxidase-like deaminating enzyme
VGPVPSAVLAEGVLALADAALGSEGTSWIRWVDDVLVWCPDGDTARRVQERWTAALAPGVVLDGIAIGAYEPQSGYADPSGAAAGFLEAARRLGARYLHGCRVSGVAVDGERVVGVDTDRGRLSAPVVVDAAGAWARR